MNQTRPYRESDRQRAAAVLGDAAFLQAAGSHAHVSESGADDGIAVWREPAGAEEPYLGAVIVPAGAPRQRFYRLVLACAEDAQGRGFTRARFRLKDARLLARLRRDFTVDPRPCGREPNTGRPVEWEIVVELADALRQLARVLRPFGTAQGEQAQDAVL